MQEEVSQAVMSAKVLKVVWILCSVAVLVVTLVRYAPGPASDIGVFLVYGMLFLAFPISLLCCWVPAMVRPVATAVAQVERLVRASRHATCLKSRR